MDQLPRLGKRELICLLSFTCNYVVFVWRGFLFLWVLGMGYVILLWHSLSLPYNYFKYIICKMCRKTFENPLTNINLTLGSNPDLGFLQDENGNIYLKISIPLALY